MGGVFVANSATKGEAMAFERHINDQEQDKFWLGDKADKRRVIELVELWFNTHGITLAEGEKRQNRNGVRLRVDGKPTHNRV